VETRFFRENLVSWLGKEHRLENRNLVLKTETWFSRKNQVSKRGDGMETRFSRKKLVSWLGNEYHICWLFQIKIGFSGKNPIFRTIKLA
jgi:hypothetical protein